jgi:hypothetical protein
MARIDRNDSLCAHTVLAQALHPFDDLLASIFAHYSSTFPHQIFWSSFQFLRSLEKAEEARSKPKKKQSATQFWRANFSFNTRAHFEIIPSDSNGYMR